jgi:Glycosyl hydrolases family 2, TIM barrel domain/Glycosyl hydrolases family 2/Glycosyl hydrolases family 2, sugar binding domain
MINRRRFVSSLGVTTLLPAFSAALRASQTHPEPPDDTRSRLDLNGPWERHVNGTIVDVIQVPSSQRPSGFYHLRRNVLLPKPTPSTRFILHFDAITYHGRAFINDRELGTMGPYVPYEFDITPHVKEGGNSVDVTIADLCPDPSGAGKEEVSLGVNPGWEAYGGVIRDVYVESRPAAFIDNVRFVYKLDGDYTRATCAVRLFLSSSLETSGQLEVALQHGKAEVARAEATARIAKGASEVEIPFALNTPALWSPEEPNLYQLAATLRTDVGSDRFHCRTGFRELVTRGRAFELNGQPLVLNGVCRHDIWKDQGFTLSRAQMERDMRAIKALGCNFVRLVHYPHHRYIVELADQLGLLVTEEPGYWQVNFKTIPRPMIDLGLHIMERTIRRDWNSPSVFAWLLGNESRLTVEYLREGKALCNKLDPISRLVSFASDTRKEEAKPMFEEAGLDFFDQHPYTYDVEEFKRQADFFGPGKPLILSEWGGKAIGQSEIIMQNTVDRLLDLVEAKQLAGHMFWSWQDVPEFSRIDAEMRNGILESGAVTEGREPRELVHMELGRLFQRRRHEGLPVNTRPALLPLHSVPWSSKNKFTPLDLQPLAESQDSRKAWADLEARLARHWAESPETGFSRNQWKRTGEKLTLWQGAQVEIGGVPFRSPLVDDFVRPLTLTPGYPTIKIPVTLNCTRLHFLGQVTLPGGFPPTGRFGETTGTYTLRYAGGRVQNLPLRNGIEVARANLVYAATRIDPVAPAAQRVLCFVKDWAREQFQVLLFSVSVERGRLDSVTAQLISQQTPLLIFAITVEQT